MDSRTTASFTNVTSSNAATATPHAPYPWAMQQPAQGPGLGIRPPQTGFPPPPVYIVPIGLHSLPQYRHETSGMQNANNETSAATLIHAAGEGDLMLLQAMLADGADINSTDYTGWTALHDAAWRGQDAVVKWLLSRGMNLNLTDRNGVTVLMLAGGAGHSTVAQTLIDAGADLARRDHTGKTAIDRAREMGHFRLAMTLSAHQETAMAGPPAAPRNVAASTTTTAALSATTTTTSSPAYARNAQPTPPVKPTSVLEAARRNDIQALTDVLFELEQSGRDVSAEVNRVGEMNIPFRNPEDGTEVTALMAAAYYGYKEIIELLLGAGAEVDTTTR